MIIRKVLIGFMLMLPLSLQAQTDSVYFGKKGSWLLGNSISPNFELLSGGPYVFAPTINPRAGYFLKDKWLIGLSYQHTLIFSNVFEENNFVMAGPFTRYHFLSGNSNFIETPFFLEAGYQAGNYTRPDDDSDKKLQQRAVIGAGVNFKLSDTWYLEAAGTTHFSLTEPKGPKLDYISYKAGINYLLFPASDRQVLADRAKVRKQTRTEGKENKAIRPLSDRFYVGAAGFFLIDSLALGKHKELVFNPRVGYHISQNLSGGFKAILVRTYGNSADSRHYYFAGPFLNYDIPARSRLIIYMEVNSLLSNYSVTDENLIKTEKGLQYWGAGGGMKINLTEKLKLDLALIFEERLNTKKLTEGYTYYRLGLVCYPFKLKATEHSPRFSAN